MKLIQIGRKLDGQIKIRSKMIIVMICVSLTVFMGVVNSISETQIVLPIFYFGPILVITWYVGTRAGAALIILITTIWLTIDPFIRIHSLHYFYWNVFGRAGFLLVIMYIISSFRDLWIRENQLAREDHLTGVANRRYLFEILEKEIYNAQRYKRPITIGYLDIDNFKLINDNLGHNIGDEVLCLVARTIKNELRSTDIVARLGGDEFAVLLPETSQFIAQKVFNRIESKLLENMKENNWSVTFSIGVNIFNKPLDNINKLIEEVDITMYSVKKTTKNAICYRSDEED